METIAEHLKRRAEESPDKVALISPTGTLTFGELQSRSDWFASALPEMGIGKGTRTVLMVRPGPELMVIAFALMKVGAVPVLVDPGIGWKNLKLCLDEARPAAFIGEAVADWARFVLGWGRGSIRKRIVCGRWGVPFSKRYRSILDRGRRCPRVEVKVELDDLAAIAFTSGSTGPSKGVIYTHRMFSSQARLLQSTFQIEAGEFDLATFPLFALFDPMMEVTAVFPRMDFTKPGKVDPRAIIDPIRRHGVTHMFGSPALLDRVSRYASREGIQLPSIRRVLSAGAPVSDRILHRFQGLLSEGAQLYTPYGATEALPVTSIAASERFRLSQESAEGRGVCVGRAVEGVTVKVIQISEEPIERWSDELEVPRGAVGEIVVKGPNVSPAYHRRERANALSKIQTQNEEIFHRMGDLGYVDEHERLWFCGRKGHRVISESETLYSVAVEGVFNGCAGVFRTALVGVGPAPRQRPVLCVELEEDVEENSREEIRRNLLEVAQERSATRSVRTILFHPSFPVDVRHNAKIFREKLAVWAERELS